MAANDSVRVHPILLTFTRHGDGTQTCDLCQASQDWSTSAAPAHAEKDEIPEPRQWMTLHLVHLVREHLGDVNESLTKKGRAQEFQTSTTDIRKQVVAA